MRFFLRIKFLILMFFFLSAINVYAISGGVRPTSLGGAFVAISDDANAATWNPAGLAWQQDREVAYSGIFTAREEYIPGEFISDDYFVYAQPLRSNYRGDFDERGGIGVYFLNSGYEHNVTKVKQTIWQPGIAYGLSFGENRSMAWGVSANFFMYDSEIPGVSSSDSAFGINAGYMWFLNNKITLGLLIENINEPTITLHGLTSRILRIWRPAIAYYFSEFSILSLEIYDLTGNTSDAGSDYSQNIRLGFEQYLTDDISIRLGAHNINSSDEASKYFSLGIGYLRSDFFDTRQMNYYIDYTFVYWADPISTMEDYTHQLGITIKF